VTPIGEIAGLGLGSRPASRPARATGARAADVPPPPPGVPASLDALRAIPWVFAWSQARANLPGWYGLGTALEHTIEAGGAPALERLRDLYARWPLFASVLDTAELSIAKADPATFRRHAALASGPAAEAIRDRIEAEYARSLRWLLLVTDRERLLERQPFLARAIALRNPYVDALAALQVELLARLRRAAPDDPQTPRIRHLVGATVSGVAAGLQNTG
jgi:phosphoenolpyruvate carboxylase